MLEYAKTILSKVSFSRKLFGKELRKCINWVEKENLNELRIWCYTNFKDLYPDILDEAFDDLAA